MSTAFGQAVRTCAVVGTALAFALSLPGPARAEEMEPLEVPTSALPGPDDLSLAPAARLEAAATSWAEHGYNELPVLAWAALDLSRRKGDPALAARAAELAPQTPAVLFESAHLTGTSSGYLRGVLAISENFPALAWLMGFLGAVIGLALLVSMGVLGTLLFARNVRLLGHAFGHLTVSKFPPLWPGVVVAITCLALLPLLGFGPVLVGAIAVVASMVFLDLRDAVPVTCGLALTALALGPALDAWSAIASLQGRDAPAYAAWRIERAQPLPGDRGALERGLVRAPDDPLLLLAQAAAWKRDGDLDRAESVFEAFPADASAPLRSRADNMRGILALARGDVRGSVSAFEAARDAEESGPILYNLSQAHGRALRLVEQSNLFTAAARLDPELVGRYTSFEGRNVHRYLIEPPLPMSAYLERGFRPSAESRLLASSIREATLGSGVPDWTWWAMIVLPAIGLVVRRRNAALCVRCLGIVCELCGARVATGASCRRCSLGAVSRRADGAVLAYEVARTRKRQAWVARGLALCCVLAPGSAKAIEGRVGGAFARLFLFAGAVALLTAANGVPTPPEVGAVASLLPKVLGGTLLVAVYLPAVLDCRRRLASAGATS